jgi:hypothetical protein
MTESLISFVLCNDQNSEIVFLNSHGPQVMILILEFIHRGLAIKEILGLKEMIIMWLKGIRTWSV